MLIQSSQLFFLDSGPGTGKAPKAIRDLAHEQDNDDSPRRKLAWIDSDDDRVLVSLATNTRLRKLRNFEGEDVINGREYIKRLRRQYERLHPTAEWARQPLQKTTNQKKRRRSNADPDAASSESASDSDVSMTDSTVSSTQPLANLLRARGPLTAITGNSAPNHRRTLRPGVIDIQKTKAVTTSSPASISSLQFHSTYPLLLVSAGQAGTISLHHISPSGPNPNPLLTSLHMKKTPIVTAAFCPPLQQSDDSLSTPDPTSTRIFLSGRRRYFHTWSLSTGLITKTTRPLTSTTTQQKTMEHFSLSPCGRYTGLLGSGSAGGGTVNVLSTVSTQWLCSARVDSRGGVADFAWWGGGNGMSIVGKNGEVSEYSVEERRVLGRWIDEGAVGTTVIALGAGQGLGGSRWVAIGSSSGIVNMYDRQAWSSSESSDENAGIPRTPKPARSFDQLTTPTSHLTFSGDGQMLVMASRWKRDALRLVHLPSCTVYKNWPTDRTPLGRITAVALSPDGGLLVTGNEQGKVKMWEIRE